MMDDAGPAIVKKSAIFEASELPKLQDFLTKIFKNSKNT